MSRILVVDDEPQIVRALDIHLRARGYEVATASDGTEALQAAASRVPDLVILDLGLPDLDGVEVITGLRGWSSVPILVLSGRADSVDKVDAFDAGADDYVTKPFGMDELLARLRAMLRRNTPTDDQPKVTFGEVCVDLIQLDGLVTSGNTVILVEHDMHVIAASDWVIDIGPGAGEDGGKIVAAGTPGEVAGVKTSRTAKYLALELG